MAKNRKIDLEECYIYRMDYNSKTVLELRALAKMRGFTGYSRLRKAELVSLLSSSDTNLIDSPIPDIQTPTLIPSNYIPKSQRTTPTALRNICNNVLNELRNNIRSKINSFSDWLINYVPAATKKTVNDKLESLKLTVLNLFNKIKEEELKVQESESAMNGFTKNYSINGIDVAA